jgi:hypothetical protein
MTGELAIAFEPSVNGKRLSTSRLDVDQTTPNVTHFDFRLAGVALGAWQKWREEGMGSGLCTAPLNYPMRPTATEKFRSLKRYLLC